jgi:O-antigen/teichoic acid export membrane protein
VPNLAKNTILYTIGNFLPQAAGFILLPIYSKYLLPEDYGIVSSMQVISSIFIIFFTLAIDRGVYRLYFDFKSEKDKRDYLGTIVISLIVISSLALAVIFISKNLISKIFDSIDFYPYYVYAILTSFISTFSLIPFIYFQLKEQASKYVALSIISFIISTSIVLILVVVKNEGAIGILKGQFIGKLVLVPIFLIISYRIINLSFKWDILKTNLKFSLPMLPSLLSAWILNLSDRIFIENFHNLHDVGIYSIGYKIASLILILFSALNMAYTPVFYKIANSADQIKAKMKLSNYNNVIVFIIILGVFLLSFFSKEVVYLFLNEKYIESYKIIPIIAFSYLFSLITGLLNLMFYQNKKTLQLMYIIVGGSFANIIFNFMLVPKFGASGAASSTVLSFALMFFVELIMAKNYYYISFNWIKIFKLISILVLLFFIFQINFGLGFYSILTLKIIVSIIIGTLFIRKNYSTIKILIN